MTYLTCSETAQILRCEPVTIRRGCVSGKFPGASKPFNEWLIPREAVDALLEKGRTPAGVIDPKRTKVSSTLPWGGLRAIEGGRNG